MSRLKVEGHTNLVRDTNSGAILNINKTEIEAARAKKLREKQREADIIDLKNEVGELKNLLKSIIDKLS
jgi:hypothetical protein